MEYYHIELSLVEKQLCTNILPWGKYEYKKLPIGIYNSPNIFQENLYKLFEGFDMLRAYIYDILVISKNDFKYHINTLDKIL